jgi:hypothetical protein
LAAFSGRPIVACLIPVWTDICVLVRGLFREDAMTISAFIHRFDLAGSSTESRTSRGGRVRRFVARHRLTDEERQNLRDYYRRNRVQSPAIMTAALGGHPRVARGQR